MLNGNIHYILPDRCKCVLLHLRDLACRIVRLNLRLLADEGSINAQRVLKMQEKSVFFAVARTPSLFAGIVGDAAFRPPFPPFSRALCRQNSPSS